MVLSVDSDYDFSQDVVTPVSHPDMKFAVANENANNIKVTNNNIGKFKTNSAGDLVIEGFGGKDKITGTSGNDYIDGGVGADVMNGRRGDDTYRVDNIKDKVVEASNQGVDTIITITDFESGIDLLSLNKNLFKKLSKGFSEDNLVFGSEAQDSNDYLIFNTDDMTLYYDADGSGTKSDAVAIVVVGTMITFDDIKVEL